MKGFDIGHKIKIAAEVRSIAATNGTTPSSNAVVDRTLYGDSAILVVNVGTPTGSSGSFTVDFAVHDDTASNGSFSHTHQEDGSTDIKITQATAAGMYYFPFNCRHLKQYLKIVGAVSVTTWTNVPVSAFLIFEGKDLPVTNS
ncbi:MAG: hypothetical protein AB2L14_25335 [Candidatus Xenobiia bacterium LiM19]